MKININWKLIFWILTLMILLLIITNTFNIRNSLLHHITPLVNIYKGEQRDNDMILIKNNLSQILKADSNIESVIVYKFVMDKNGIYFKGQMNIASEASSKLKSYEALLVDNPFRTINKDENERMQDIFMNRIHYSNTKTINNICNYSEVTGSCGDLNYFSTEYRSIITIPLMNKEFSVIGYTSIILNNEYDNNTISELIVKINPNIDNLKMLIDSDFIK